MRPTPTEPRSTDVEPIIPNAGLPGGVLGIDAESRRFTLDGRLLHMTPKEFDLLAFFVARPRRTFSRSQLLEMVWASSSEWQDAATVTEHIYRLRAKIEPHAETPVRLVTVKGAGYRFEPDDVPTSMDVPFISMRGAHGGRQLSDDATLVLIDGTVRFASPCALDLLAVNDPTAMIGRAFLDLLAPASKDAGIAHCASVAMGRWPCPESMWIVPDNGTPVRVDLASMPVFWEGEQASQVTMWDHATDVPDCDEMMTAVRPRMAADSFTTDPERRILGFNPAPDDRSGRREDRVIALIGRDSTADDIDNETLRGMRRDEFTVHYQPVVDIEDSSRKGAEALVRWQHPTRGLLLPGAFIASAERSGVIVGLGEMVLQAACRQAQAWRNAGQDLNLSVNLSARQLTDDHLPERIAAVMAATSMPADRLWLEVTETALVKDIAQARTVLRAIDDLGARISIDDFGTGWASLTYLHEFPIRQLKIDGSFVVDLDRCPRSRTIVQSIISLGRDLGIEVIAEGIETDEQRSELIQLGCRLGQGFLFGRPLPPEAFDRPLALQR